MTTRAWFVVLLLWILGVLAFAARTDGQSVANRDALSWDGAPLDTATMAQGAPIDSGATVVFNGVSRKWESSISKGDVAGTITSSTVAGIRGWPVSATPPTNGQVLEFKGPSTWTPRSYAGDVTGAPDASVVAQLQGRALASSAPVASQAIVSTNGTSWTPGNPDGNATSIRGNAVANTNPVSGQFLGFVNGAWSPLTLPASGGGVTYPLLAPAGSQGAPSYSFTTNTDMGVWRNSGMLRIDGHAGSSSGVTINSEPSPGTNVTTVTMNGSNDVTAQTYSINGQVYWGCGDQNNGNNGTGVLAYKPNAAGTFAALIPRDHGSGVLSGTWIGDRNKGLDALFLYYDNTATVGNVTIDRPSGTVNMAALATTMTVTNSLVTANSHIFVTLAGDPGAAVSVWTVGTGGSFTINTRPALVNQTPIDFLVVGAD